MDRLPRAVPSCAAGASPGHDRLALDAFDLAPAEVRRRFDWAARQGRPKWLWPDLSIDEWGHSLERIACVTREILTEGHAVTLLDGDAATVGVAGYTSGMGPLLGHWLAAGKLAATPAVAAVLELHLAHNRLRMQKMASRAACVSGALAAAGVEHAFLKGMHSAWAYFPEPGARPVSDLDLLIRPGDEANATRALLRLGLEHGAWHPWPRQQTWRVRDAGREPRCLCLVHADDPWSIDLHTTLDRRYSAGSRIVRFGQAAIEHGPAHRLPAPAAGVLAQPVLLLQAAVHASSGSGLSSLSLIRLVEMALIVRADAAADGEFWPRFVEAARLAGALAHVYPALRLCEALAPGTVPVPVIELSQRSVPARVRAVVDPLTPARAHRVVRCSLKERYMWMPSRWHVARQLTLELFPSDARTPKAFFNLTRARLWRLFRGTITA